MDYYLANKIARHYLEKLQPHCDKVAISGKIAQLKTQVDQIDIVGIPKFFEASLFKTGIAAVLDELEPVRGSLLEKDFIIVRKANEEINIYFYNCHHFNYGYILAYCNSPADYQTIIKNHWLSKGFKNHPDKYLTLNGNKIPMPDEELFFTRIGMPYVEPEMR